MPEDLAPLLEHYRLVPTAPVQPVGVGTLNWNYRVETDHGPRFVRKHRADLARERIEQEHELVRWAVDRGIPAPLAHPAVDGETVVEHEGALWAVFPWVEGSAPGRGEMTTDQVRAAGEMHGRIHRVLADHPLAAGPFAQPEFDTAASIALLESLVGLARDRNEAMALGALELQVALLRRHGPEAPSFAGLTTAMSHGDYHDQQLLFEGDRIVAVTDWELFGIRPRLWEVIRSLYFSQVMEGPHMEHYLAGYREHAALPADECRLGMELWWQGRLHTSWVFSAYFFEGNERVAEFFPESLRALRALADANSRRELTERFVRAAAG